MYIYIYIIYLFAYFSHRNNLKVYMVSNILSVECTASAKQLYIKPSCDGLSQMLSRFVIRDDHDDDVCCCHYYYVH